MERPKWNLTGDITAVIFVCALTEYNQVLREDIKQNRLKESLNLFDIACNRRYPDKPILLFLNKKDLFAEKIKHTDLKACFPTYKGARAPLRPHASSPALRAPFASRRATSVSNTNHHLRARWQNARQSRVH